MDAYQVGRNIQCGDLAAGRKAPPANRNLRELLHLRFTINHKRKNTLHDCHPTIDNVYIYQTRFVIVMCRMFSNELITLGE